MCLAVPGQVESIRDDNGTRMGRVNFGGVVKDVCLAYLPEIAVGRLHDRARRLRDLEDRRGLGPGDAPHLRRTRHPRGGSAELRESDEPAWPASDETEPAP